MKKTTLLYFLILFQACDTLENEVTPIREEDKQEVKPICLNLSRTSVLTDGSIDLYENEYDENHRLQTSKYFRNGELKNTTNYTYQFDADNNLIEVLTSTEDNFSSNTHATNYTYYSNGNVKEKTYGSYGNITTVKYNIDGEVMSEEKVYSGNVSLKEFTYSGSNLVEINYYYNGEKESITKWEFENNQLISYSNQSYRTGVIYSETYQYNELNQLISDENSSGLITEHYYNDEGFVVTQLYKKQNLILSEKTLEYDSEGRLLMVFNQKNGLPKYLEREYTYHPNGQKATYKDYIQNENGETILYTEEQFDENGNQTYRESYWSNGMLLAKTTSTFSCFISE